MGRHAAAQEPVHVLYVGNSADLGALRRLMEAHGAVTRSRLTPEVTVVVADASVPADHPAVLSAGTLGIPVMAPAEAMAHYASWRTHTGPIQQTIQRVPNIRRHWLFRRFPL